MPRRRHIPAETLARAEANGYKKGAHEEQDKLEDQNRHNGKTKQNQDGTLNRYVFWHLAHIERDHLERGLPAPSEEKVRSKYLGLGTKLPGLATVKDFLRYYIHTSQPGLNKCMTADSMVTVSEWFFACFTRVTGTVVPKDVRSEVYSACPSLPALT